MKKILFASLVMLALGGISYGQTTPAKTTQKKEAVKPASSVSSVTTAANKPATKAASTTKAKPAGQSTSTQTASANAIRKHKKPRHTTAKKGKK